MTKKILMIVTALVFTVGGGLTLVASASETEGSINTGIVTGMEGVVKAAPTLLPVAGTYTSSQTITLTAAGATKICYTTDGLTTPSCASPTTCTVGTALTSGGTVSVTLTTTIKSAGCYADSSTGPVATSLYTLVCPTVANAATYNVYPTCGPATCNSGYTLSGSTCVANSSGGGGGGGGGAIITYCTAVTFGAWQTSCFNGTQFRSALTQTPTGCTLTAAHQLEQRRTCSVTGTSTPPVTPPITPPVTPPTSGNTVLENIASEAGIVSSNNTDSLLNHLGSLADTDKEQNGLIKYKTILGLDKKISAEEKLTINDFIVYGTQSTHRLGAGERAAVINSYFQAYGKLPNSEAEWSDVLKIASGRWPIERSAKAEAQAKIEFKKVYARNAVMTNNIDENAIMVIAYGLLPLNRNLNSEKVAIKTFRWVYGHDPVNALAWNIVRAIAYSGATR